MSKTNIILIQSKYSLFVLSLLVFILSCNSVKEEKNTMSREQKEVEVFLHEYNIIYQKLAIAANNADWVLQTRMIDGDTVNDAAAQQAKKELAAYTGSSVNIKRATDCLAWEKYLTDIQVKQLKKILYNAADNPQTIKDIVDQRIKAETEQSKKLYSFKYVLNGKEVSVNDIDGILGKETNEKKRLDAWNASKEVGKGLKAGLVNLRDLRNKTVQGLGYPDYFSYQVSDYGMSNAEMMALLKKINAQLWPVFRELHTYARYELAKKYSLKMVPDMLPAHLMPNRWGQDWSSLADAEGIDLDKSLKDKSAEWIVKQGEELYISIGFDSVPPSFWVNSDLYPLPKGAKYKKNNHASAWHIDLGSDVRSLMSVEPNARWYETAHHELGHIHYYLTYTNEDVPFLLREGANRAYHEAFGSMMGFAAMQKPFLSNLKLIPADLKTNDTLSLLKEALHYVVFIPWSAGVMSEFEHDLYTDTLPVSRFNERWWELAAKYQGMAPPVLRGEEYCDAATKTHINDDAAQYYDYALSFVILFQVHDYIAKQILHQDPHATNYYGNKDIGKFLKDIMYYGSSKDWRQVLKDKTGEELSARAMVDYFAPLLPYLKKMNEGREYTLPENLPEE